MSPARLTTLPYSAVLGFPRATKPQLCSRAKALRTLGVTGVSFEGTMRIGTLCVLGKGYTGIVVGARWHRKNVALKIRRTDSPRKTMSSEARLLSVANKVGVGPKLYAHSRDALVMEYVGGMRISDWMSSLKGVRSAARARRVIRRVLESSRLLDKAGIDHGELSMISKHALVCSNGAVTIIDFESASSSRQVSNVTSATQALVIGAALSIVVRKKCKIPPKRKIISLLRDYKSSKSDESFTKLLEGMGL